MTHDEFEKALEAQRVAWAEQAGLLSEQRDLLRDIRRDIRDQAKALDRSARRAARSSKDDAARQLCDEGGDDA